MPTSLSMSLPIEIVIPQLIDQLMTHHQLVLEAPPGAGKTTRVPLALLDQPWLNGQKIIMLEPRRLAARGAAERMAAVLGEAVGQTVGYRVRMDTCVGPATRIEVITEGILTRMLQEDPSLEGVGLLIFDEFHERSLDADLGLAMALQGRELLGELRQQPLKLLVMSATLDGQAVSELLSDKQGQAAPVIRSEGRMFPVELRYGAPYQFGEWIAERVVATVLQALADEAGSLLVFLPGQGEIRQVHQRLQERLQQRPALAADVQLTPLYGDLKLEEQRQAIAPAPAGKRKVVLATSIAESSLTIDGVRVVIDSGLARIPCFDPNTGMTRLQTVRVSRASATQRMGRAGRLQPGVCYRLWSESQQQELRAFTPPEIAQADLAGLAVQLLRWGVADPAELRWLDVPPAAAYQQALTLLTGLGALTMTPTGPRLSAHGERMAALPVHPRLAHMLLIGQSLGLGACACELAALLAERDPFTGKDADVQLRLELIRGERKAERQQQALLQRIRQQLRQFQALLNTLSVVPVTNAPVTAESAAADGVGLLLACAYPDRIARRRDGDARSGHYQLSNGRSASFAEPDPLQQSPWLVVGQLGGRNGEASDRIFMAAELSIELLQRCLPQQVSRQTCVDWDSRSERLVAEQQCRIGALVISRQALNQVPASEKAKVLCGVLRKRGLDILPWTDELRQWRCRVNLLRQLQAESVDQATDPIADAKGLAPANPWPDVSDAGLLATTAIWFEPYLDTITQLTHFASLDLRKMLSGLLPWPLPQQLDELAPERLSVPSGSRIAIDYSQQPPVLAVKLQEMFGCRTTPCIAGGKVKLVVHLLSPARRPIQVTQDLEGFWTSSYLAVKKDMKSQYPRHQWPDNPLEATPTARTTKPRTTKPSGQ